MRMVVLAGCFMVAQMIWADVLVLPADAPPAPEQIAPADPNAPHELIMSEKDTFVIQPTDDVQAVITAQVLQVSAEVQVYPRLLTPEGRLGFSMELKFIHDPVQTGKFTTPEATQQGVEEAARPYIADSAEGKTTMKPLKYAGRQGWYTTQTDKRLVGVVQPQPNDFRYAAVGMIRLSDDTVLQFRLFVDDLASKEFFRPLEYALKFAKPLPTTQPAK